MSKKILAIGGHPDDMEQFAGGTLLHLSKLGHRVTIAALTDGACGSHTKTAEEIVRIRLEEAREASKLLGASYSNLGIADGSIEYNLENVRKLVKLIRGVNPDIIFTHPAREDYMTDHWHTGALVLWAVPEAGHKNFEVDTKAPPIKGNPHVYHTDPQGLTFSDGQIARVNTIVDITETVEKKLEAFAAHTTQMSFLFKGGRKTDEEPAAARKTRRWAITRGEQVRVPYGEGFTQQLLAEYPKNNILSELLPGKVYSL